MNTGQVAAITAEQMHMQGGVSIRVGGKVVGAVDVSGFDKTKDVERRQPQPRRSSKT